MDAVTEVLLDRSRDAQKISGMIVLSLVLHGILLSVIALVPYVFSRPPESRNVMTISLGGAPGPVQGHTAISAKPVQQAAPDATKKPDTPPALPKPEMVEPLKTAKLLPKATAKPEPTKETTPLHGSKPTQGAEVTPGAARVETHGAQTTFGGLATGGGGAGAAVTDVKDFCCPDYLISVTGQIQRNWQQKQGQDGVAVVAFTIHRDGSITDIVPEQGASAMLTMASQRAIVATQRVTPLPAAFTGDHLTVHLAFQYQR